VQRVPSNAWVELRPGLLITAGESIPLGQDITSGSSGEGEGEGEGEDGVEEAKGSAPPAPPPPADDEARPAGRSVT
jgi:hypothetical protein